MSAVPPQPGRPCNAPDAEKARRWREDNAEAIADSNRYVEANGLPLADLRRF